MPLRYGQEWCLRHHPKRMTETQRCGIEDASIENKSKIVMTNKMRTRTGEVTSLWEVFRTNSGMERSVPTWCDEGGSWPCHE